MQAHYALIWNWHLNWLTNTNFESYQYFQYLLKSTTRSLQLTCVDCGCTISSFFLVDLNSDRDRAISSFCLAIFVFDTSNHFYSAAVAIQTDQQMMTKIKNFYEENCFSFWSYNITKAFNTTMRINLSWLWWLGLMLELIFATLPTA